MVVALATAAAAAMVVVVELGGNSNSSGGCGRDCSAAVVAAFLFKGCRLKRPMFSVLGL